MDNYHIAVSLLLGDVKLSMILLIIIWLVGDAYIGHLLRKLNTERSAMIADYERKDA